MIYIELELTTKCQLKCSYCCANSPTRFDHYPDDVKLAVILRTIKQITNVHDIAVRLMGGEPTMFKHINTLIANLNSNPRVRKVELYTNLMGRVPRGDYITVVTLHLGQYARFIKNMHKIQKLPGTCVLNVMLPKYEEFTQWDELKMLLDQLPTDVFVHPQPIASVADTLSDISKYKVLFSQYNEYFETLGDYYNQVKTFFLSRPILCHPDNYRISEDLILTNDCEYVPGKVDLMKTCDLSIIKLNKVVCKQRMCYVDNCVYCDMK